MFMDLQRHSKDCRQRIISCYRNIAPHLKRAVIICGISEHLSAAADKKDPDAIALIHLFESMGGREEEAMIRLFESLSPDKKDNIIVSGLASYIAFALEVSESPDDLACTLRDHLQLTDEELAIYSEE